MGTYILVMTLTPEGREAMLRDAESVLRAAGSITTRGVQVLGLYAVLGEYDFVCILNAPSNQAVALFSVELGVRAGVHISTMPAIPIGRLEQRNPAGPGEEESEVTLTPPRPSDSRGVLLPCHLAPGR